MSHKTENVRGLIKWAGGKQRISPIIISKFQSRENYYEPFSGGGTIFLNVLFSELKYSNYFISDGNPLLIEAFNNIKNHPLDVISLLESFAENNSKEFYLDLRVRFKELESIERTSAFLYINRVCFNGLYRENSKGIFNVPYGSPVSFVTIVQKDNILKISDIIQNIDFSHSLFDSFYTRISEIEDLSNSFFYFDPPYYGTFTDYISAQFNVDSQIKLFELCKLIGDKNGKFVLSNSSDDFIKNLYSDFEMNEISVKRSISANINSRKNINELLVNN